MHSIFYNRKCNTQIVVIVFFSKSEVATESVKSLILFTEIGDTFLADTHMTKLDLNDLILSV